MWCACLLVCYSGYGNRAVLLMSCSMIYLVEMTGLNFSSYDTFGEHLMYTGHGSMN